VSEGQDFTANLNANSLEIINGFVEQSLRDSPAGMRCQFLRQGYFCVDSKYTTPEKPVLQDSLTTGYLGQNTTEPAKITISRNSMKFKVRHLICACRFSLSNRFGKSEK